MILELWQEICKMSVENLVVPERKKMFKTKQIKAKFCTDRGNSKEHTN